MKNTMNYTVSIHPEVMAQAKKILKPLGMSTSKYFETALRCLIDSQVKTAAELYGAIFDGMGLYSRQMLEKKKKEMEKKKKK